VCGTFWDANCNLRNVSLHELEDPDPSVLEGSICTIRHWCSQLEVLESCRYKQINHCFALAIATDTAARTLARTSCMHSSHLAPVQKLIVFNHPSWVDAVILLYLFAPSGVSREANLRLPLVGAIIKSFQNIYVPSRLAGAGLQAEASSESATTPLTQRSTTHQIAERCVVLFEEFGSPQRRLLSCR
jgi:hypothetical protein